ncbi:MAG: hypothetical protein JWP94_502 [Mucilaginibacter sp.]|nr:hypothetical protein [Mucilaginibacter sp.]
MESIERLKARPAAIRRRTRHLLMFSLFTLITAGMVATAQAQTFAEWFAQKSTQKKYLLQQIAALQVFSGYLKQGYQVATKGMSSISGSLKAENGLHTTYYARMKTTGPEIKNNAMVQDIMTWQQDILSRLQGINNIIGLTTDERNYLANVKAAVLKDCDQQLYTLQNVITDGKMQMSDPERLALLTKVHVVMMNNYRFASGFTAQAKIYGAQRQQELNETATGKQLYGIK